MKKTIKKEVKKTVKAKKVEEVLCASCKGTGRFPDTETTCSTCNGSGK